MSPSVETRRVLAPRTHEEIEAVRTFAPHAADHRPLAEIEGRAKDQEEGKHGGTRSVGGSCTM
jgi:hypothetical protein